MQPFRRPRFASRRTRRWAGTLAGTLFVLTMAPAHSQTESDMSLYRALIAYERDTSEVMPTLEYLSDMIGPRLTGSARMKQANDWTADKMKEYGLENVHLEAYTIPRGWERSPVQARIVSPNGLPITAAQRAWTPGTRGKISGPVVLFTPQSEADFAAFKGKLKNAIVLTVRPEDTATGMTAPNAPVLPPIKALTLPEAPKKAEGGAARSFDFRQYRELNRKRKAFLRSEGAAAVLEDSSKPHALLNMTGSWSTEWGAESFPSFFVTREYIAMLHRLLARKVPVQMEIEANSRFTKGPITVYNTVGEIRGTEKPDEVVLLGAHLDSWDLGTGTTDNGTGSSVVLEVARVMKKMGVKPKRTIRFVLFSGEEQGLFGSTAYAKSHQSELNKFNVVFVHDTGTGRVKGLWLQERAECQPRLEKEFALLDQLGLLTEKPSILPNKMNGTDHAPFDDLGVPAFAFLQDRAEYGLTHHSQSDTFDKARSEDLKQGACVLAILAYNAAQNPEFYPRKSASISQNPTTETHEH